MLSLDVIDDMLNRLSGRRTMTVEEATQRLHAAARAWAAASRADVERGTKATDEAAMDAESGLLEAAYEFAKHAAPLSEGWSMTEATKRPWAWQGEDYRGGWGWQLLVGPSGEGIACGQTDDGPYKNLRAYMPIESRYCKTGLMADDECAPAIHIREPDAAFLLRAVNAHDDMLAALKECADFFERHVGALYGPGHDISMAAGAELVRRKMRAAIKKAEAGA